MLRKSLSPVKKSSATPIPGKPRLWLVRAVEMHDRAGRTYSCAYFVRTLGRFAPDAEAAHAALADDDISLVRVRSVVPVASRRTVRGVITYPHTFEQFAAPSREVARAS